jgi:hypothetical protein
MELTTRKELAHDVCGYTSHKDRPGNGRPDPEGPALRQAEIGVHAVIGIGCPPGYPGFDDSEHVHEGITGASREEISLPAGIELI